MSLVTVQVQDYELLDMLLNRCDYWETSKENKDLFEKMYQDYLNNSVFSESEFNVMSIVDNDVVNYCDVLYKNTCKDFKKILKLYKDGYRDVSCEIFNDGKFSFIEAVSDDEQRILVRY